MNPSTIELLLSVVSTVIQETPAALALFQSVKTTMTQGSDPTPDQWRTLLAAVTAAHQKVQAA